MWVRGHSRSLKLVPFAFCVVTMAVSVAVCEIFSVKEWCDPIYIYICICRNASFIQSDSKTTWTTQKLIDSPLIYRMRQKKSRYQRNFCQFFKFYIQLSDIIFVALIYARERLMRRVCLTSRAGKASKVMKGPEFLDQFSYHMSQGFVANTPIKPHVSMPPCYPCSLRIHSQIKSWLYVNGNGQRPHKILQNCLNALRK